MKDVINKHKLLFFILSWLIGISLIFIFGDSLIKMTSGNISILLIFTFAIFGLSLPGYISYRYQADRNFLNQQKVYYANNPEANEQVRTEMKELFSKLSIWLYILLFILVIYFAMRLNWLPF